MTAAPPHGHPGRAVAALGVVAIALFACKSGRKTGEQPPLASAAPAAAPPASAPPPGPPHLPAVAVGSSWTDDRRYWVQAFRVELPSDAPVGAAFIDARLACEKAQLDLCGEEQWALACTQEPKIGEHPSWTISAAGSSGWVVRGGSGCTARSEASDGSGAAGRIGLCCERRAAITTSANRQQAVMKAAQTYIGIVEDAYNSRSADRIVKLLSEEPVLFRTRTDHDKARKDIESDFKRYSRLENRLVRCEADAAGANGWFECDTVGTRTKTGDSVMELATFRQRFEYENFKYTLFGDPRRMTRKWGAP